MTHPKNYRGIPQPVSDSFVRVELKPSLRYSRSLNYVKTDKRYLAELRFHSDVDLALFEKFVQNSSVRLIEYRADSDHQSRLFVTDARMTEDGGGDDAIWQWIDEELPRIGAAIATFYPHFILPMCRCVVDLNDEAGRMAAISRSQVKPIVPTNLSSVNAVLKDTSGHVLQLYLTKCGADTNFGEAMMYCGRALGFESANAWADLYRAYEVIADRFGGHDGVVKDLPFCSKNQLIRFKRTANHQEAIGAFSRHARLRAEPPPDPMNFNEAVEFVLSLVRAWQELGE